MVLINSRKYQARLSLAAALILMGLFLATSIAFGADGKFIKHGFPVEQGSKQYPNYSAALRKFPNLLECQKAGFLSPRTTFFELNAVFQSKSEVEVCHYWYFSQADLLGAAIADYFGDVPDAKFRVLDKYVGRNKTNYVLGWNAGKLGLPYRSLDQLLGYGATFTVVVTNGNQIHNISLSVSIL